METAYPPGFYNGSNWLTSPPLSCTGPPSLKVLVWCHFCQYSVTILSMLSTISIVILIGGGGFQAWETKSCFGWYPSRSRRPPTSNWSNYSRCAAEVNDPVHALLLCLAGPAPFWSMVHSFLTLFQHDLFLGQSFTVMILFLGGGFYIL